MNERTLQKTLKTLEAAGWTPVYSAPFTGLAKKEFETAVGSKTALLYWSARGDEASITAVYESEGRNVLAQTSSAPITQQTSDKDLTTIIHKLNGDVVHQVNQSYARRLHLDALVCA